jgi:hypothetical protein
LLFSRLSKVTGKRRNPFKDGGKKNKKVDGKNKEDSETGDAEKSATLQKYLDRWRDGMNNH